MCKGLVGRAWMSALILFFSTGMAWSQMATPTLQNPIAWGWPTPAQVAAPEAPPQPVIPPDSSADTPGQMGSDSSSRADQTSADTLGQTASDTADQAPSDTPADSAVGNPADGSAVSIASNSAATTGSANPDNTVRQLGTPFPLQLQPEGVKIGPFYLTNVSDSFFYAVNTSPNNPSETFAGNSTTANIVYSKTLSQGVLAFQAKEQFSLSQLQPFFNQSAGLSFNDQLTDRWSFSASAEFVYFQNSILANPQYVLGYQNGGIIQQTLFVLQRSNAMYESNSIAFSYTLNGRTHLTLTPILGATFLDQEGGWASTHQFGGGVGLTRDITPNFGLGAFYNLTHSVTTGIADSPSWNSQSLGVSFQYKSGQSWSIQGALAASGQLVAQVWTLTPTGSLRLMKSFRQASIVAAYTRSEASSVFVSSGYYDQADIGYNQRIGQKITVNAGVGEFRTSNTGTTNNEYGKRAGAGIAYQWFPRLSVNVGYNLAHQNGTQTSQFSPVGDTSYFSVGLTWLLGAHSGL